MILKKPLIALTVMLTAAVLVAVFSGPAAAKVTGRCDNCHTMHNSRNGTAMATDRTPYGTPPYGTLLVDTCVGCHSDDTAVTYDLGGCDVPVVYTRGGIDFDDCLAGGNFYWVAQGNHAMGHNVLGIADKDGSLLVAPGKEGGCNYSCHYSLAEPIATQHTDPDDFGTYTESGCTGCHLWPAHHADDSNAVVGSNKNDDDGFYRFLSGHKSGNGFGVCGIEDSDWQALKGADDHNEYLGNAVNLNTSAKMQSLGNTMTGFCCGCHGNFHDQNTESDGSGSWIRHPSDAVIPNTGEYADAFGATDGLGGIYDPNVPVARGSGHGVWTTGEPSGSVHPERGNDMVMCLSCHVPHGSPNDDLLRWDYSDMIAGGDEENTTGCFVCHTKKDTGG